MIAVLADVVEDWSHLAAVVMKRLAVVGLLVALVAMMHVRYVACPLVGVHKSDDYVGADGQVEREPAWDGSKGLGKGIADFLAVLQGFHGDECRSKIQLIQGNVFLALFNAFVARVGAVWGRATAFARWRRRSRDYVGHSGWTLLQTSTGAHLLSRDRRAFFLSARWCWDISKRFHLRWRAWVRRGSVYRSRRGDRS